MGVDSYLMKLALNYSPQALALLEQDLIDVDLLKCSDEPAVIADAQRVRPAYVHFPLNAGRRAFSPDWSRIGEMMRITGTRFVNIHLEATAEDWPDIPVTSDSDEHFVRIREKMIADVREAAARFGAANVILENGPYHAEARTSFRLLRPSAEPRMITEVIQETGCGLLLDIDHARVSAHYLSMTLEDYIAGLPTDTLKEVHMTGTRMHAREGWLESHHEMQQDDWLIFGWALGKIRDGSWACPELYAFEYGGIGPKFEGRTDPAIMTRQLPLLRAQVV